MVEAVANALVVSMTFDVVVSVAFDVVASVAIKTGLKVNISIFGKKGKKALCSKLHYNASSNPGTRDNIGQLISKTVS